MCFQWENYVVLLLQNYWFVENGKDIIVVLIRFQLKNISGKGLDPKSTFSFFFFFASYNMNNHNCLSCKLYFKDYLCEKATKSKTTTDQ